MAVLYLATSARRGWWLAPVLGGIAVSAYTAGIAWAGVVVGVCAWRALRSAMPLPRRLLGAVAAGVVPAAVALSPLLWWQSGPDRVVAGGGTVDGTPLTNLGNLFEQLAVDGQSYATGEQALQPDFPIPAGPMPATFARWDQQLRSGQLTVQEMVEQHDGLRTLAVVWMLADRTGRGTAGLPDPAEIVAVTTGSG